jgi:hypothetical protein
MLRQSNEVPRCAACIKEDVVKALSHATALLEKKGHAAFEELQILRRNGREGRAGHLRRIRHL